MVNTTSETKPQDPIVVKETMTKKIPAPIPDINVWQLKKSNLINNHTDTTTPTTTATITITDNQITSNSKFMLFILYIYDYINKNNL